MSIQNLLKIVCFPFDVLWYKVHGINYNW
jgi:hypothetical protein